MRLHTTQFVLHGVITSIGLLFNIGCAAFQTTVYHNLYSAQVGPQCTITLDHIVHRDALRKGGNWNNDEIWFHCDAADEPWCELVDSVEFATKDAPPLHFGALEGRTDESRRRVWIFESDTGRIIAIADLDQKYTLGPGEALPAWAAIDAGVPLKSGSSRAD